MSKLLATVSALGFAALVALPGAASAKERASATMKNSSSIEVSSARRHHHRHFVRHYYGPRYYGRAYDGPYDAYAYSPYYYRLRVLMPRSINEKARLEAGLSHSGVPSAQCQSRTSTNLPAIAAAAAIAGDTRCVRPLKP
jgi:hypothetical protein